MALWFNSNALAVPTDCPLAPSNSAFQPPGKTTGFFKQLSICSVSGWEALTQRSFSHLFTFCPGYIPVHSFITRMSSRIKVVKHSLSSEISTLRLHMKHTLSLETSPRSLCCSETWTSIQGTEDSGEVISGNRLISAFAVSLQTLKQGFDRQSQSETGRKVEVYRY